MAYPVLLDHRELLGHLRRVVLVGSRRTVGAGRRYTGLAARLRS